MFGVVLQAQSLDSLNQEVSPIGGINNLAVKYYGIDFNKEQRKYLKNIEIEFIFQIDEEGSPILSEVNGVSDQVIIDSLKTKTSEIPKFHPRIKNGIPEPSIYFMQLTFPNYVIQNDLRAIQTQAQYYQEATLEDFEYIEKFNQRIDVTFGGVINQFIGKPSNYLGLGGGARIDVSYTDKRLFLYGLNMSFYGNRLKKEYPINIDREQLSAPVTGLVGAMFGKWYGRFNIQGEINVAVQNVSEKLNENDSEWIQLEGWSPGLLINYPIRIGADKNIGHYMSPTIFNNNINLHLGIKYLFFSIPEAKGAMLEFGLSYRMTFYSVSKYKLKDSFFDG